MVTATFKVEAYLSGSWSNLTSHLLRSGIRHHHGINGNGPMDVVAGTGEFHFELRNDAQGSRLLGQFSPGHANCLSGWDYNVPIRVIYNDGTDRQRWTGKVAEIEPDADPNGRRTVRVVAYDKQRDLIEADVQAITPQVGQSDSTLIGVVLDALPTAAQPLSRSIASGLDTIPYAFDKLGANAKATNAIGDVTRSTFGLQYTSGAGVCTYKTRQQRFSASSIATLTDADISGFRGPTSRAGSFNAVQVQFHPKRPSAGIVLWEYTGSAAQVIRPGETIELKTYYRDPDQTSVSIGAASITTPVAGTDYVANEFADGSGVTLTADLSLTGTVYNTTHTAWRITNTGTQDAWIGASAGIWRVRGTGIYDDGEQVVEKSSTQPYGRRPLFIDLPLQSDRYVAAGLASLILSQRESPVNIPQEVNFFATRSSTLMTLAMTAEIGDIITLSNALTGVSSATCAIQRIEMEPVMSKTGNAITALFVRFLVAPTSALTPPSAPTGLAVANASDSQLTPSWTNTDGSAETEIYVDGVLWTVAAAGATSVTIGGLDRATDYTITAKHAKYALLRSSATAGVTGRPHFDATYSGTHSSTTFSSGGTTYQKITATGSGNFVISKAGRVNWFLVNGGAGGGGSDRLNRGGGGGAGGAYLTEIDNAEPATTRAVVIGAGGAGGISGNNTGSDGGATTYDGVGPNASGGGGGNMDGGAPHNGNGGILGGGGSGDDGVGGSGSLYNGGNGATFDGVIEAPGGGGAGGAGAGGSASPGSTGGARGAAYSPATIGGSYSQGGKGGGSGESPANASANTGNGGDGTIAAVNGVFVNGKDGGSGVAIFWWPI